MSNAWAIVLCGACALVGWSACSGSGSSGITSNACASPPAVEAPLLAVCASCTTKTTCSPAEPLEACCAWTAEPKDALSVSVGLHEYSPTTATPPNLGCLTDPGALGMSQTVTLTGYVQLFASGQDSAGVVVDVFAKNHPESPDGTIPATSLGTYTTSATDPIDSADTTWDSFCPNGCSFRQYTIPDVPTETPLVIRTAGPPGTPWATAYEYNVYLPSSDVGGGQSLYNVTAFATADVPTFASALGLTLEDGTGLLIGEVHDCSDYRLSGATANTSVAHEGPIAYFTDGESNPRLSTVAADTTELGSFVALSLPTGLPIQLSAVGENPAAAGTFMFLGTYTVQAYPGAVTRIALRGRRPWQL